MDDVGRGPVILFKLEQLRFGVVLFEVQNVLNIRASKGVNALRIVPNHANVFVDGAQLLDDQILGEVGVLVFVHEDVPEPVLVFVQEVGEVPQQDIHLVQEIVKIHGPSPEATHFILSENVSQHRSP